MKNLEQLSQATTKLQRETTYWMSEMYSYWKDSSMASPMASVFDHITAGFRQSEQGLQQSYMDAEQKLKTLKKEEEQYEEKQRKRQREMR
jgi:hypothetical protein